jgi:6-phosphofructokinase 1
VVKRVAVLTSGGDSAGMNAAVRAVVRSGLAAGLEMFGVEEGLQGLVDGGERIRPLSSSDVSAILQQGGTALGTARSADFRERGGRRQAAANLARHGIDALVVIGGDGSLSGADELRREWPELLAELVAEGTLDDATAGAARSLALVGLVGSIDNDMFGTDMTIGADTTLHRITEAVDAIQSTASSHQRTFVIEVMGRNCGYLALMSGLATGANFVLIPESPPPEGWEQTMCDVLGGGRAIGRRANIVIVAEGARDRAGVPITASHVRRVLEERLGEDARVTILGHVQRGGAPSAFDRYLGSVLGHAAIRRLVEAPDGEPTLVGSRGTDVVESPLMECVAQTRSVARLIEAGDYEAAMQMRGPAFVASSQLLATLVRARPRRLSPGQVSRRLAILHAGSPAPGMNAAVRTALRVGMDRGHELLAVEDGFAGLAAGRVRTMEWMSVSGWVSRPGASLGTTHHRPDPDEAEAVVEWLAAERIDGLLMIGGLAGYAAAAALAAAARRMGRPPRPVVCVPASINNDLPGSDLSIGADTALNSIVSNVDKIKDSAVAAHRCFVVEVMGYRCGYLALMAGLATGAERVHLPEEPMSLERLRRDIEVLAAGFALGKRRGVVIRNERVDDVYTTPYVASMLGRESGGHFDVRHAVIGHVQQGGRPSPFDRIQATRLAARGIEHLVELIELVETVETVETVEGGDASYAAELDGTMLGLREDHVVGTPLCELDRLLDPVAERSRGPWWWMDLRPLADLLAAPR